MPAQGQLSDGRQRFLRRRYHWLEIGKRAFAIGVSPTSFTSKRQPALPPLECRSHPGLAAIALSLDRLHACFFTRTFGAGPCPDAHHLSLYASGFACSPCTCVTPSVATRGNTSAHAINREAAGRAACLSGILCLLAKELQPVNAPAGYCWCWCRRGKLQRVYRTMD